MSSHGVRESRRIFVTAALALALVAGSASPSLANDYEADRAGHPLRVLAYVAHPVGVILSTLIFRPAHWLVHRHESIEGFFGHTE